MLVTAPPLHAVSADSVPGSSSLLLWCRQWAVRLCIHSVAGLFLVAHVGETLVLTSFNTAARYRAFIIEFLAEAVGSGDPLNKLIQMYCGVICKFSKQLLRLLMQYYCSVFILILRAFR